jgi:hypothetical protein
MLLAAVATALVAASPATAYNYVASLASAVVVDDAVRLVAGSGSSRVALW